MKLVRCSITENGETALHIAASAKGPKKLLAAGNIETVKIMMAKNPILDTIPGGGGQMMPLYAAALFGKKDVVNYLYKSSKDLGDDGWNPQNRGWPLEKCVESDMFGSSAIVEIMEIA
ncbi:ankyrin repeat-containing domain, PGG domain protein [Tanacetum coccineum]